MKQKIQLAIGEVLADLKIEAGDFTVEYTEDFAHGDVTTNVAMVLAKKSTVAGTQNPRALAEKIVVKLKEQEAKREVGGAAGDFDKIEVAGPGFINFFLSRNFFSKNLRRILKEGHKFGQNDIYKGQKIMIEHTNLNPFKVFHIGHLVNHAVGESISRLLENAGAEVKRVSYGGDVGLHVAKTIWGMKQLPYDVWLKKNTKNRRKGNEPIDYLGEMYANGSFAYEDDKVAAEEIKEINKEIFERSDGEINKLYDWGKAESLKYFAKVYDFLGVNFAYQFFESEMAPIGLFLVEEFLAKGIFQKSEGAVVFKGEDYGLHTRVFVTSQGLPTYETKELGLTKRKMELYPFDLSIVVTANEQNDYFKVLLKVIEFIFPTIAGKMRHISHGLLRFAEGKMSSRKGNVVTGETLIKEIESLVDEKISNRELSPAEKRDIRQKVALAAIKFSILKQSPGSDIIFEADKSVSFEGDSGPYLQYSAVRAQSVLRKAVEEKIKAAVSLASDDEVSDGNISDGKISDFEKLLVRFPDIVERATVELAPQKIVTYLLVLAASFNSYYANNKIVDAGDRHSAYKVALTKCFEQVMSSGLGLLGIAVPDKM